MKTYTVYIEEKLCKGIDIDAESIEQAEQKAKEMYNNSEIVLDSNDIGTDAEMMTQCEETKESTDWHTFNR